MFTFIMSFFGGSDFLVYVFTIILTFALSSLIIYYYSCISSYFMFDKVFCYVCSISYFLFAQGRRSLSSVRSACWTRTLWPMKISCMSFRVALKSKGEENRLPQPRETENLARRSRCTVPWDSSNIVARLLACLRLGWHYLSNATSLARPRLFSTALLV